MAYKVVTYAVACLGRAGVNRAMTNHVDVKRIVLVESTVDPRCSDLRNVSLGERIFD